jgi:4-hydroxybenzoate polyprenyltransferase
MDPAADRPLLDSTPASWVERAPPKVRPFLRLARYDRPIGIWLLAGPSWLGIALANVDGQWRFLELVYAVLLGIGSIAMRGAGCTFNDIVDKDLDAQVARTADRPLPAGTVSVRDAWLFLAAQCVVGLLVLIMLPRAAQLAALASIPVVAAYPFMKRITWFPQAWLGIALNWGVLVGFAAATGRIGVELWLVFAGLAAWTFGYDTIYAHQDKEDDALVGVKSTARLFGDRSRWAVLAAYEVAVLLLLVGALVAAIGVADEGARYAAAAAGMLTSAVFALMLARQVIHVRFDDPASCLAWFRTNRDAILAAAAVLAVAPLALRPFFGGG